MFEKFKTVFTKCPIDHRVIEFIPSSEEVDNFLETPSLSKSVIPQWYKDSPTFDPTNLTFDKGAIKKPLKMCVPFLDALTSGYVQKTWCEISISAGDNFANYMWAVPPAIMEHRETPLSISLDPSYVQAEFHWKMPWIVKLPKGYSLLITHPHNRLDLPFTTLTGIVDADEFHHVRFGQLPFYIKKTFNGIIPIGTPMFQMIPIKREAWKSERVKFNETEIMRTDFSFSKYLFGAYKNFYWKKKKYD